MIYRMICNCLEVANALVFHAAGRKMTEIEWGVAFGLWMKVHDFLCIIKPK